MYDEIRRNLCDLDEEERIIAAAARHQTQATNELERLWTLTYEEDCKLE